MNDHGLHVAAVSATHFEQGVCKLPQRGALHRFHQFHKEVAGGESAHVDADKGICSSTFNNNNSNNNKA